MKFNKKIATAVIGLVIVSSLIGQEKCIITIKADKPIAAIQPTMWGVFFEDINMGADGGIYAELVKNRSFEFYKPMMGWTVLQKQFNEGAVVVLNRQENNTSNPRFIRVNANNATKGTLGLINEGFRGMGIKKDLRYNFSIMYRQPAAGIKMHIELVDEKNVVIGTATLVPPGAGKDWKKIYEYALENDFRFLSYGDGCLLFNA